jgi:hypothetical protein
MFAVNVDGEVHLLPVLQERAYATADIHGMMCMLTAATDRRDGLGRDAHHNHGGDRHWVHCTTKINISRIRHAGIEEVEVNV